MMKHNQKNCLKVFLTAMILSLVFMNGFHLSISAEEGDVQDIDPVDWMKGLPDDALITDLNLPGAHDAASYKGNFGEEEKV